LPWNHQKEREVEKKNSGAPKRSVILRFLSSGKFENLRGETILNEMIRYITMNIFFIAGTILLISFAVTAFLAGNMMRGFSDSAMALLCIAAIMVLRTRTPFTIGAGIPIGFYVLFCAMLTFSGGENGFAGLWIFTFPPIAIFTLGMNLGAIFSLALFIAAGTAVFAPHIAGFDYPLPVAFRLMSVYALITILTMVYEWVRLAKDQWVKRLTRELQIEQDKIVTMQNNISAGLFLMDNDTVIQGAYSNALENILSASGLAGKKFTDLLSSSFRAQDIGTITDYFNMVMESALDETMLKDMNPLQNMIYTSVETREEKQLKCGFARVEQGKGEYYILGTIEDITVEAELQKRLEEEERKRQEEMRALFEVMQVDPKVFSDFVEDMEFEFDRINGILRKGELSNNDMMMEMYQSAHAIKSNAVILGLENFGGKVHELESQIKEFRKNDVVSFEDMLHISVELEQLMREKDKFKEMVKKIKSFGEGDAAKGDVEVFIETLTKAGERVSADTGKKASLKIEQFDAAALARGPRRIMKEALTQLVRNAVYHGIETPETRRKRGKEETGSIELSIVIEGDAIHIVFQDDGQGLDFDRIGGKAKELGLIPKACDTADESYLSSLVFMPAFSTADHEDMHAGRGIGLSLVHERIKEVNGSIQLRSLREKGTKFEIRIPAIL
jgi:two-component system chemotaxis sensor kinase CheA